VYGEPGVGKTALVQYAVQSAHGFRVTQALGVEGEMELPFAALQQMCASFIEFTEHLPQPQREALAVAFGLSEGPAASPFFVGLAVLGLMAEAAAERPLLCVVDDAQWLDRASARALTFVARRLLAERIALVLATRDRGDALAGLPELHVEPLGRRDARALLESVLPAWHGTNHSPDNIFIHLPDHDALMLVDIVNPGWPPVCQSNLTEDVPGFIAAPDTALTYPWKHFIGGHMGRLGNRNDVATHRQYMADISDSSRKALDTVDPTPYFIKYGENPLAAVREYLDAITAAAAAPVIDKYAGVLAAADIFTASTVFHVMQSIRLDLGYGSQVHP
jgi:AAA ATPase domain